MVPDDDNPVTDTRTVTDPTRVTGTRVADARDVVKPAPARKEDKRPKIGTLFLYDKTLKEAHAKALHATYYKGSKIIAIGSWDDLGKTLALYSSIDTLVLFTHSIPGELLLGGNAPTVEDAQKRLTTSGVKVTGSVVFEGCSVMRNPVTISRMFSVITGKGARLKGHTYFSVFNTIEFVAPKNVTEQQMKDLMRPHARYFLPGQPTAKQMADKPGKYVLIQRWFRDDLDETPAPPLKPGDTPDRKFTPVDKVVNRTINTTDEAKNAAVEFGKPVYDAAFVTVTDVPAAAKGE